MNKHESNALAGPWNARKALNWAEADAYTAKNTAFKHTLKGSVRRGMARAGETAESLKNRIKGIPGKIEKASANSENAEKVRQAYQKVKENASIDWTIKESVRAKLKVIVKRILRQYGYPPDMQILATETVLKQAELIAEELTN